MKKMVLHTLLRNIFCKYLKSNYQLILLVAFFYRLIKHNVSDNIILISYGIKEGSLYQTFYTILLSTRFLSLILLGIVVLAFGLAPFSSSSTENKRSAIINKHYNDNFKK